VTSPPSHPPSDPDDLRRLDARHVWHPYAPAPTVVPPRVVTGAAGARLTLDDGRELVDGMSSWWAAIHGYRHPVLDEAVQAQLGRVAHVMFGGLTHEPAIRLAQRLVAITPVGLERVFLCDSGSVAVEVAAKMAMQFWQAQDRPRKSRLLTIRGGYHGDTFMAMSVCDPVNGMHHVFTDVLKEQVFAPMPPGGVDRSVDADWLAATSALFAAHADELAAVIIEPVVQGAGGMRFYDPSYVTVLRRLCDEHEVLLIADEIATGFGRAGALFAMELAGADPDIMCVGKALTGGYLSLAATLCTAQVAEVISSGSVGALLHGPTFMGNPLATAVAIASIDLLLDGDWQGNVRRIEKGLTEALTPARDLPHVADVRVLGAIGVIELDAPVDVAAATDAAIARGVWLRPFGKLVYAMPPYVCSEDDVERIGAAMVDAARVAVG
jgi:adenosylmethionine-8-amino-7-oxononanoate aminotransferase